MNPESSNPSPEDPNLSDLGRAVLGGGETKPSSPSPTNAHRAKAAWTPPSPEELQTLLPQYEIVAMLGRGGMGAVYMGRQISLDRPVAIKILSGALEDSDLGFKERFKNEARAMAKLSHPGIVAIYEFGETSDGLLYIVMEYIDGTDVARMIAAEGRLHTEYAMAITAHVCDALAYAHERGIIHRDIKPANIMVGYDGVVKVADFGLAKVHAADGQSLGLTMSGMAMGTMHYIAPEVLSFDVTVDHRADIYAVGVMLYQMLTGKLPQGLFELPSLQIPGLDPRYDGIIAKSLREDREQRYPTIRELRGELDAILTQPVPRVEEVQTRAVAALPTMARPKRPGGKPSPAVTRRTPPPKSKAPGWIGASLVVAVVAVAGYWVFFKSGQDRGVDLVGSNRLSDRVVTAPAVGNSSASIPSTAMEAVSPQEATKERPFVNSLGMKFVPVPGTGVLFSIWTTRVQDYEKFARETNLKIVPASHDQGPTHPAVNVKWGDAKAFCAWLTEKEQKSGGISSQQEYRLPTDAEWSAGVGLRDEQGNSPSEKANDPKNKGIFPWGPQWPPPKGAGNYPEILQVDDFDFTSPVGSFSANEYGLFDMGGNVMQWCEDRYDQNDVDSRVLRGEYYRRNLTNTGWAPSLLSSYRFRSKVDPQSSDTGFRCVLTLPSSQPSADAPSTQAAVVSSAANAALDATSPRQPPLGMKFEPLASAVDPAAPDSNASGGPTERPVDLLALIDPARDTFNGAWKRTADGLSLEGDGNMGVPFAPPGEYDFEIEFTISTDSIGVVAQQLRFGGKPITWFMAGQAPGFRPVFGFGPVEGPESETQVNDPFRFAKGDRIRSTVRVRKDSLTGAVNGRDLVVWKADPAKIEAMRIPTLKEGVNLAFNAKDGGILFHRATLTPFAPGTELPTGPTTWTDTNGRTLTATFKAVESGQVLLDINGTETPVAFSLLSPESQELARAYHERSNSGTTDDPAKATKDRPFVNSLGMQFVPVPGTKVLFCIHETRKGDYATYAAENPGVDTAWKDVVFKGEVVSANDNHPVVNVSWEEAQHFCEWLVRKTGLICRLPTDAEWERAAGTSRYLWGDSSIPPAGSGNYGDVTAAAKFSLLGELASYDDGFVTTAPVMSFASNSLGLHDLGGNVWEWCADLSNDEKAPRFLRGGSWIDAKNRALVSAARYRLASSARENIGGFRVVIELPMTSGAHASAATTPTAAIASTNAIAINPVQATKVQPFINTLGMKFVPVPGTKVLMCIHETRRADYAAFAKRGGSEAGWENAMFRDLPSGAEPDHPVVMVSWNEANAFCEWLTRNSGDVYRLPTDREWSVAVGIGDREDPAGAPSSLKNAIAGVWPFGTSYPPGPGAGNYADIVYGKAFAGERILTGFEDGYATTAPVMRFAPNELGIFDLGGNVWEWCSDRFSDHGGIRVMRGAAFDTAAELWMRSSHRTYMKEERGTEITGFRVVIELP